MKFSVRSLFCLTVVSAVCLAISMANTIAGFFVTCIGAALISAVFSNRCCNLPHAASLVIGLVTTVVIGALFSLLASTAGAYQLPDWLKNNAGEWTTLSRLGFGAIAGMNAGFIFVAIYNVLTNNLSGWDSPIDQSSRAKKNAG